MKKSTLCAFAVLVVGTISCNMTFCAAHYPVASALSVTASASEAIGNLIVQISGLPVLSGVAVTVTGDGNTYTAVTNDNGQAAFSKLPVNDSAGNPITYTIKETIPDGYMAASSMTTMLSAGFTVIATIPNTERTYTIAIDCKDYITDSIQPSGDAVLSGGSYTVYHDGEAYGTYAIDSDGSLCEFTLHNKEYEGTWEIQMDEPPTGYYLDPTMQELGYYDGDVWMGLTSFFPQYTHATMHLSLIPISGRLSVTGNVGDTIQMYLQSAGSYENCRTSERAELTVTDAEKAVQTDMLPYGKYVVSNLTTGESVTAEINSYGEIVSVDLKQSAVITQSSYYLYDKTGKTLLSSGNYVDGGTIALPEGGIKDAYYRLIIEQDDPDSSIGTALTEMYIVLHEDGTYEECKELYPPLPPDLCGDVNIDGSVDLSDAVLLNKYCSDAVRLSDQALANGDCNADGQTDMNDSIALLRFLVHLETELPVTE